MSQTLCLRFCFASKIEEVNWRAGFVEWKHRWLECDRGTNRPSEWLKLLYEMHEKGGSETLK